MTWARRMLAMSTYRHAVFHMAVNFIYKLSAKVKKELPARIYIRGGVYILSGFISGK